MQKGLAKFSLALHLTSFSLSILLLTIAANQSARKNSDMTVIVKKLLTFENAAGRFLVIAELFFKENLIQESSRNV